MCGVHHYTVQFAVTHTLFEKDVDMTQNEERDKHARKESSHKIICTLTEDSKKHIKISNVFSFIDVFILF
jgi:hypothetical protein